MNTSSVDTPPPLPGTVRALPPRLAPRPETTPGTLLLICVAGPDAGKSFVVSTRPTVVGLDLDCECRSDDPATAGRHAVVLLNNGGARFEAIGDATLHQDGQPARAVSAARGQTVRMGNSTWQIVETNALPSADVGDLIGTIGGQISAIAGVERVKGWSAREMFSDTFKSRSDEEMEEYFIVGTGKTTPDLRTVPTGWPKPWVFFRVFALSLIIFLAFVMAWTEFKNPRLLPGLIMIGSLAIPFSMLIFFFEMNVLRNVSLYQVLKWLVAGGIISLIISLFGFRWFDFGSWLGAASAGLIEETGKALTLLLLISRLKYRWILNGLLFGATVGAGFEIFESAGYALVDGAVEGGSAAMLKVIQVRALFSVVGSHILWTGLVGAALWQVAGQERFRVTMLQDPRFLRVFGMAIGIHMLWNSPLQLPFFGKYLLLGFVAWLLLLGQIQAGLRQVRHAQAADAA